jgi:hypothetical protein
MSPWVLFHAPYDGSEEPVLSLGRPRPVAVHGDPVFEPGVVGRAIRFGARANGVEIRYAREGNLDFSAPGGLSFWVRPVNWRRVDAGRSGYVRFIRSGGRDGSSFVLERDVRRPPSAKHEKLLVGFFDLRGSQRYYLALRAGPPWRNGRWHFVAASWDAVGFAASVDGQPLIRRAMPEGLAAVHFPAAGEGATWVVGDRITDEGYALDELRIYSRALRDEDVRALFAAAREGAAP